MGGAKTEGKKSAAHWFAERTSMHGVPSLIKSSSTGGKMFWSFVCVAGLSMFAFMLISLIKKYYSYPVVVKIGEVRVYSLINLHVQNMFYNANFVWYLLIH